MAAADVPWLGQRIREERGRRGVSLRGLARDVGVSASMISQIETGKSSPSVSTLYAITSALGISVEDLFTPPDDKAPDDKAPDEKAMEVAEPRPTRVAEALGSMRGGHRLGPLVRPTGRRVLTLDSGVTWELLGELPHRSVDFLLVTYAPGGSSSSTGGLMRHQGAEYGFLISGELILTLGFEELHLRPGDAISFDSTTPHSYRNKGRVPAVGVWYVTEESH
jgi:transcriptional regulator with XRE-family HTH domain